jgi:hypothetical protein
MSVPIVLDTTLRIFRSPYILHRRGMVAFAFRRIEIVIVTIRVCPVISSEEEEGESRSQLLFI